ncbi:MAG: molybdenum cofactor biosynthesis protein [Candidatus Hydrogenedentota bacterium]|jgi:molybdenum cofactor biosynthesis protein B
MSESTNLHRELAAQQGPVKAAIITVSDSRTPETDKNGQYLKQQLWGKDAETVLYTIIPDEPEQVAATLDGAVDAGARIILFNGGTGIAPRDTTIDVLRQKLEKELPGFGEIFRMLSYQQVGSAAILSRATAGVYRGSVVISTPGSHAAVTLAWEKLIGPELDHLAWEVGR